MQWEKGRCEKKNKDTRKKAQLIDAQKVDKSTESPLISMNERWNPRVLSVQWMEEEKEMIYINDF